jgi:predicted  nucleic acid-binding Zn-ribbon protein
MSTDPPELGKGLFGYRKSAVNQILSDRDLMLRQAEGRVRAAESKVGQLENELIQMRTRNTRMDEQLERLRTQLDALSRRAEGPFQPVVEEPPAWEEPDAGVEPQAAIIEDEAGQASEPPAEGDLSYGFEVPGTESAEPEGYGAYGGEAPAASLGDYGPPAAEPESYWSSGDQAAEVHMETGPDYAEQGVGADVGEAEGPAGEAAAYEPPQFTYGGEQAISEPEQFTYGGDQAVSQPEESEDEMDSISYGAELVSPYEAPAETEEEEQETAVFEAATPSAYEPSDLQAAAMEGDAEDAGEPAEYQAAEYHRPAEYEPAPYEPPAEPQRPPASTESAEITSRFVTEEIAGVLSAAEESASRILERARVQSEQQVTKSSRLWEEVRAEVSRMATWREGIEPVIQTVLTKVEGIRSQIEDVPERIREALAPMADSISGIDSDLAELAEACSPPLLLAPSELEPDEGEGDAAWERTEGREHHRNAG